MERHEDAKVQAKGSAVMRRIFLQVILNSAARALRRCRALRAVLVAFLLLPVAAHAAFTPKSYFIYNFACGVFGAGASVPSLAEVCSCGGLAGAVGLCNETTDTVNVVSLVAGTPSNCNVGEVPDAFCRVTGTNKRTGGVSVSDPGFAIGRTFVTTCPANSTADANGTCTCNSGFLQTADGCNGGKNNGGGVPGSSCTGNPCNAGTGNKLEPVTLYRGLNGFDVVLTYNSQDNDNTGRFGRRRHDTFDRRIIIIGANAVAYRPDGKALQFVPSAGAWVTDADTADRLTELKDASGARTGWRLQRADGDEVETYDASGRVLTIASRTGLTQSLVYSDGSGGPNGGFVLDANGQPTAAHLAAGLMIRAADNFGRTIAYGYDKAYRVVRATDPAGGAYRFAYDGAGNLVTITFPDAKVFTYVYNESANTGGVSLPSALTGIVDENGARFATFKYDAQERAVSTEHAGGAQRYTLSYGTNATTVTDPLGTVRTYLFQTILAASKTTGFSGAACPACGPQARTYDANGNIASSTDWNGNRTNYVYDLARNLETARTEGLTAAGGTTPQTRTISTEWHAAFRLPARVAEPLRITTYVYNGDGGVQCGLEGDGTTLVPGVPCSKTVQATTDAGGAAGFGATLAGSPRTSTYTYNANGSVLTVDGPRTDVSDVTSYAYYANDDPDPGKRGNVATIADALGHVTSIAGYNAHGQPTQIVDANGVATVLGYDARQRLVSRDVGGEVTVYDYDGAGQLTKVTLPDGSFLSYTYDPAHRLTGISDIQGNRIAYTLDAMGNRTKEEVFDPAGALALTRSRVFDGLNRLAQEIGATSQTTVYAYDDQGNVTSVTDPLTHATSNQYDALNRLVRVTDPGLGVTQYGYDGVDRLVSVTDPRSLATGYVYDGLGNLKQQLSPDSGTTTNTYDAAGNLLTQTDAKGQVTAYAYDALSRVASITFHDGSRQAYAYDQGPNGIGRLAQITETDPNAVVTGTTAYAYDAHGRVISETRTIAGVPYVTAYQYDTAGRMTGMTYPSGRQVTYGLDSLGRILQVSTVPPNGSQQAIASGVTYQPFGGVKSYTLGNGQPVVRGYDLDGRIASYTVPGQTFAIGYDAASRISFIADAANPAVANNYGYDPLDRLTSAVIPNNQYAYVYDAVGNRTSKTVGSATDTYAYSPASNRIASITAQAGATRPFVFDPNGSTTGDGVNQYVYDARGRMVQSTGALGTTTYQVNALGQRVRKTNSTEDRIFHYDTKGRLIAETDPGGAVKREYIYLNDLPLAVFQ
jgi:YD repeat-containing protein